MALTPAQLTTLKAAILAETNNTFVGYRNNGQTDRMAGWLNQSGSTDAWMDAAERRTIFEAIDLTKFDALNGLDYPELAKIWEYPGDDVFDNL